VSEIDDDVYDRSDLAKDVVAFTPTEVRPILPTDLCFRIFVMFGEYV
jgi:hypothetical protein